MPSWLVAQGLAAEGEDGGPESEKSQSRGFRNRGRGSQKALTVAVCVFVVSHDVVAGDAIGLSVSRSRHAKGGVSAAVVEKALLVTAPPHDVIAGNAIGL